MSNRDKLREINADLLAALKDALVDYEAQQIAGDYPALSARIATARAAIARAEGRE